MGDVDKHIKIFVRTFITLLYKNYRLKSQSLHFIVSLKEANDLSSLKISPQVIHGKNYKKFLKNKINDGKFYH